jgi:hypothetical protein
MIHFRLAQQLPDQDTELARKVTVLKFAFTTDQIRRSRFAVRCSRPLNLNPAQGCLLKSTDAVTGVDAVTVTVTRRSGNCGFLKTTSWVPSGTRIAASGVSPIFLPSSQTSAQGVDLRRAHRWERG